MNRIRISSLSESMEWDGLPLEVETHSEVFQIRRMGAKNKSHHYQVWHAFAWGQQALTGTQWRNCVNMEAAIQLMQRFS